MPRPALLLSLTAALAAPALLAAPAAAQDAPAQEAPPRWVRTGDALSCRQGPDGPELESILPCLRIGPLRLGGTIEPIRARFGAPFQTVEAQPGTVHRVYTFQFTGIEPPPYALVTFRRDTVVAVQLTGRLLTPVFNLSGVQLGDRAERAVSLLGAPMAVQAGPEEGMQTWSYAPWPLALVVQNGRVTSMRVFLPPPPRPAPSD